MDKKSLLGSQIIIVLYLLAIAISSVETTIQFKNGGFSNWKVYLFGAIFGFSVYMYFVRKKQRLTKR